MADPGHIYFTNPDTHVSQGEKDAAAAASGEIRRLLYPIYQRYGNDAILDALISLWLDLCLHTYGVAAADRALRHLRRDLPKIAAARRALQAQPKDRPDA
jgi:hypothetical protein